MDEIYRALLQSSSGAVADGKTTSTPAGHLADGYEVGGWVAGSAPTLAVLASQEHLEPSTRCPRCLASITSLFALAVSISNAGGTTVGAGTSVVVDGRGAMPAWNLDDWLDVDGTVSVIRAGSIRSIGGTIGNAAGASGLAGLSDPGSAWTSSGSMYVGRFGNGTLNIDGGAEVRNASGFIGYASGGFGTVAVRGLGTSWNNTGLGVGQSGRGSLIISDGAAVISSTGYIGNLNGSIGEVTAVGHGTTWQNTEDLYVGRFGQGSLVIRDGASVTNARGLIGNAAGSAGTVDVHGADSNWVSQAAIYVGLAGEGSLTIAEGASVSNTNGFVGYEAGATGRVDITGSSSEWTSSGGLAIGHIGKGVLAISNGGVVRSGIGYVGNIGGSSLGNRGSLGAVTIDGVGSSWENSGPIYVGRFGTGALVIANGGALNSVGGIIGQTAWEGSYGMVEVTDIGSVWNSDGDVLVGNNGTGTLTVSNGAVVNDASGYIGVQSDGVGAVTVSGAGSAWLHVGELSIGLRGTGKLTVSDGAAVRSGRGAIGTVDGGFGNVTVIGPESAWDSGDTLAIGGGGIGALIISDGGAVRASVTSVAADSSSGSGSISIGSMAGLAPVAPGRLSSESVILGQAGTLVFNHADSNKGYHFDARIGGVGSLSHAAGFTALSATNTYSGRTTISGGVLAAGGLNVLSPNSAHEVNAGGILELNGYDQVVGALSNAGVVRMGDSGTGRTLSILGSYESNGGDVYMNTVLDNESSLTDRLIAASVVAGAGATRLHISNQGGPGALTSGDGIELVRVDATGASERGAFALGSRVVAGAYEYLLFHGSATRGSEETLNGNWYLRSTILDELPEEPSPEVPYPPDPDPEPEPEPDGPAIPIIRPEVAIYLAGQTAATNIYRQTLHDRLGELAYSELQRNDDAHLRGAWARVQRNQASTSAGQNEQIGASMDISQYQLGGEMARWVTGDNRWHLGLLGGYGEANVRATSRISGYGARGRVTGHNIGLYATWFQTASEAAGLYVDTWLMFGDSNHVVHGDSLVQERYESTTRGGSIETGYAFEIFRVANSTWHLEPQAQISYVHFGDGNNIEANGTVEKASSVGGFVTRLGARMYSRPTNSERTGVQPFIEANWWHADRVSTASFNGVAESLNYETELYELKIGAQVHMGKRWTGWANFGISEADGDYRNVQGLLGGRYAW